MSDPITVFGEAATTRAQRQALARIQAAAEEFSMEALEAAPMCPDRTTALAKLREVVWYLNAAITHNSEMEPYHK